MQPSFPRKRESSVSNNFRAAVKTVLVSQVHPKGYVVVVTG